MFILPCFLPEFSHFLYPEYYNAMIERKMVSKTLKIDDKILDKNLKKEELIRDIRNNYRKDNERRDNERRDMFLWNRDEINNNKINNKTVLKNERTKSEMFDKMWRDSQITIKLLREENKTLHDQINPPSPNQ